MIVYVKSYACGKYNIAATLMKYLIFYLNLFGPIHYSDRSQFSEQLGSMFNDQLGSRQCFWFKQYIFIQLQGTLVMNHSTISRQPKHTFKFKIFILICSNCKLFRWIRREILQ